jgi:hypothetical protein
VADRRQGTSRPSSLLDASHWKARAVHAEERLRHVAAILHIPDGARYLNDVREYAEVEERIRAERDRYRDALLYITGRDVAGYDAHMRSEEAARKALVG